MTHSSPPIWRTSSKAWPGQQDAVASLRDLLAGPSAVRRSASAGLTRRWRRPSPALSAPAIFCPGIWARSASFTPPSMPRRLRVRPAGDLYASELFAERGEATVLAHRNQVQRLGVAAAARRAELRDRHADPTTMRDLLGDEMPAGHRVTPPRRRPAPIREHHRGPARHPDKNAWRTEIGWPATLKTRDQSHGDSMSGRSGSADGSSRRPGPTVRSL